MLHLRVEAPPRDEALVRAAQAGDRGAFAELYRRHGRLVHGVLLAHAPRQDADDLVQDVFLTALGRMHTLREPAAFAQWLAAIARNRARMLHRAARKLVALPDDLAAPAADGGGLRMEEVLAAIHGLPEPYREMAPVPGEVVVDDMVHLRLDLVFSHRGTEAQRHRDEVLSVPLCLCASV